jgi:hypothetical protein
MMTVVAAVDDGCVTLFDSRVTLEICHHSDAREIDDGAGRNVACPNSG